MDDIQKVLIDAREKLELYFTACDGRYVGGVEYSLLRRRIDAAIHLAEKLKPPVGQSGD